MVDQPDDVLLDLVELGRLGERGGLEGCGRRGVVETLELREGSVVTLDRMAGEPVDLLVNGTPIARGEVVVIDEQFGLRLTQVLAAPIGAEPSERVEPDHAAAGITDPVAG